VTADHEPGTADLGQVVRGVAARVTASGPSAQITIGQPGVDATECVEIPIAATGQFFGGLARELPRCGIDVADVWIQQRSASSIKAQYANGIAVRVPRVVDGASCAVEAGLPVPTCWWNATDQTVLAWVFSETMDMWVAVAIVEEFSLAIGGAELGYKAGGTRCSLPAGAQVHHGGPLLAAAAHELQPVRRTLRVGANGVLEPAWVSPSLIGNIGAMISRARDGSRRARGAGARESRGARCTARRRARRPRRWRGTALGDSAGVGERRCLWLCAGVPRVNRPSYYLAVFFRECESVASQVSLASKRRFLEPRCRPWDVAAVNYHVSVRLPSGASMQTKLPGRSITTSIAIPVELRVRLEHLRLARAQRGMRLPRLRDLVLEALNALVAGEVQAA